MPLNADQLDAFYTVVQTGGFHRAADALFISQSAVTQRIRSLESSLGARVFTRVGRKAVLTEAGQQLWRYCLDLRRMEAAFLQGLTGDEPGWSGRLAIATGSAEAQAFLLPLLTELGREHPSLDVNVMVSDVLDPAVALEKGTADAVLSETPIRLKGIQCERLGQVRYQLAIAKTLHPEWSETPSWTQLRQSRILDYAPQDRVTLDHLARCLPEADLAEVRRHFVNDMHVLRNWVVQGGGVSALADYQLTPDLRCLYPETVTVRPLYWSFAAGREAPAVARLGEQLAKSIKQAE